MSGVSREELMTHLEVLTDPEHSGTGVDVEASRQILLNTALTEGDEYRRRQAEVMIDDLLEKVGGYPKTYRRTQRSLIVDVILGIRSYFTSRSPQLEDSGVTLLETKVDGSTSRTNEGT